MKQLLIFKIWRHPYPALAAIAAMAFVFLWPSLPLWSIVNWLKFFKAYAPQNYFYGLLAILAGLYTGAYVYNKTVARCCSVESMRAGAGGSVIGILLGACPACIPALAFFLPLSATIVLSRFSLIFLLIAIGIMTFSLYKMNGFKKF